jgi:anti-sigma factor RsiW
VANADPNPRLTPELEATLRRYVLGGLEEEARAGLEEQLVTEPDVFEALGVVEDELIEDYLDGTGTELDRGAFERHFLTSPQRQARLRLARSLRRLASHGMAAAPARPQPVPGAGRWQPAWLALAAALVLSLAGNVWLLSRPEGQSAPTAPGPFARVIPTEGPVMETPATALPAVATLSPPQNPDEFSAALQREREGRSKAEERIAALEETLRRSPSSVSFVLAAGSLRAAGSAHRIVVPRDALLVRLRLELSGDDYPSYRAVLLNDTGEEVWTASKLKAETESGQLAVVLALTPDRLPRGDYQVKLSGLTAGRDAEAVGSYPFRVGQP